MSKTQDQEPKDEIPPDAKPALSSSQILNLSANFTEISILSLVGRIIKLPGILYSMWT